MKHNSKIIPGLIVWTMITTLLVMSVPFVCAQNDPPVANANGPYSAPEGSEIVFDASGSSDLMQMYCNIAGILMAIVFGTLNTPLIQQPHTRGLMIILERFWSWLLMVNSPI